VWFGVKERTKDRNRKLMFNSAFNLEKRINRADGLKRDTDEGCGLGGSFPLAERIGKVLPKRAPLSGSQSLGDRQRNVRSQ